MTDGPQRLHHNMADNSRTTSLTHTSTKRKPLIIGAIIAAALILTAAIWAIINANTSSNAQDIPEAKLPATSHMGVIELEVANLELQTSYYSDAVGLTILDQTDTGTTLGYDEPLIHLTTTESDQQTITPNEAGLYHSAILYPNEAALAATIMQLATVAPGTFQGSSDHAVSLAFYFVDPEGNGLELYVDTPEDTWVWENGEVQMGSALLDPNAFIEEHLTQELPDTATMGHVHMKVGDLEDAEAFYADTLGFAVSARSDGALFYSVGGYHHHLATNVWQSPGAGERKNPVGLGSLSIYVDSDAAIQELQERLDTSDVGYESTGEGLSIKDPWGNTVRVITE